MTKTALITGSARRIGAEIARILHQNGFNVILHYHLSADEAHALADQLNQIRKHSAVPLKADLADISQLQPLIESAVNAFGRLDVLVNNASCFYKTTRKVTEKEWDTLINTNLKSPYFLSEAAYPHLAKQKGCLVNITDIHGNRPMRDYPVYSITKAGLLMLTKTLAREWGPDVRVNSVSPGAIIWPEGENGLSDSIKSDIIDHTALKRHGEATDISKAVLFLVQNADYITGVEIAVDGGRLLFL